MRYFLTLSYNGKAYNGWQIQPNAPSVQETIQNAISLILKEKTDIIGAGRTDTGVHASYYIAHFDTTSERLHNPTDFCYHLNAMLPKDIAIKDVQAVKSDAHARFDATLRSYEYFISTQKNPFLINTAYQYTIPLDVELMNKAAATLLNYDDFTSFSKLHSDNKTNICHISKSFWEIRGELLVYHISADRFLRNMVRAIVGTLVDVGRGKITIDKFTNIIESKSRGAAGSSAAACGLFLADIEYPSEIYTPKL